MCLLWCGLHRPISIRHEVASQQQQQSVSIKGTACVLCHCMMEEQHLQERAALSRPQARLALETQPQLSVSADGAKEGMKCNTDMALSACISPSL